MCFGNPVDLTHSFYGVLGYYHLHRITENSGKLNGWAIPFGKLQMIMDCGLRRCNFTNPFELCSADLDRLRSGSFYHHVKFCSSMYMHKIFTRVVCINGRYTPS